MFNERPEKMTLGDWQTANGNIFSYLIGTAQVPYLVGVDADDLQFLLASMFSQRRVRPFFEKLSAEEVGKHIDRIYSPAWKEEYELYEKYRALEGDAVSLAQEDAAANTTRTTNTNQLNLTSGFDGSELMTDNGSDITGTDATDNTASNTQKSTNTSQSGLLDKMRVAQEREFHHHICKDIANVLTLSIY